MKRNQKRVTVKVELKHRTLILDTEEAFELREELNRLFERDNKELMKFKQDWNQRNPRLVPLPGDKESPLKVLDKRLPSKIHSFARKTIQIQIAQVNGIERFWEEAAYVAALTEYLVAHKDDSETDAEIAEILKSKGFMVVIVIGVLKCYAPPKDPDGVR